MYVSRKIISNDGQVKSFVDDLIMVGGIVSMRVALVLRSTEIQPFYLWFVLVIAKTAVPVNSLPPPQPPHAMVESSTNPPDQRDLIWVSAGMNPQGKVDEPNREWMLNPRLVGSG